jgi:hypothetical protein
LSFVRSRPLVLVLLINLFTSLSALAAEKSLLTGKAAMGDWTEDAPGVRRKITVADLPPPNETRTPNNAPDVALRLAGAQLQVSPGFRIDDRPVGVTVAKDGSLLFSEDAANTIWRVSYVR